MNDLRQYDLTVHIFVERLIKGIVCLEFGELEALDLVRSMDTGLILNREPPFNR